MTGEARRDVAVVGGGSSGAGLLLVKRFVDFGQEVIPIALNHDGGLDKVGQDFGLNTIQCDLRKPDQIEAATEQIRADHSSIKTLALFGGNTLREDLFGATEEEISDVFSIHVMSQAYLLRHLSDLLIAGSPSRVIFMSSAANVAPSPDSAYYSAAKAAIANLAVGAHAKLRPHGVGVSVLMPLNYPSKWHPYERDRSLKAKTFSTTDEHVADAAMREALRGDLGFHSVPIPRRRVRLLGFAARHWPEKTARAVSKSRSKEH